MREFTLRTIIFFCMILLGTYARPQPEGPSLHSIVNISGQHIPVSQVLRSIRKQTGLSFFYSNQLFNDKEKVNLDFRNAHLDEVLDYRAHIDMALERAFPSLTPEALSLVELGINHEQQHQELFLTDILATFAENPLEPPYGNLPRVAGAGTQPLNWCRGRDGIVEIGARDGPFAFDCERPRHREFLPGHEIASRRVTNKEWRESLEDGG